jgi:DNA polymerase (family 10)
LIALPATLRRLAAFAEVRGSQAAARALRQAATLMEPLPPRDRRALLKRIAAGETPPTVAPAVVAALLPLATDPPDDTPHPRVPRDIEALFRHLTTPAALALYRRGPSITVADLRAFLTASRTTAHSSRSEDLDALVTALRTPQPRLPLGRALAAADALIHALGPIGASLTPAGSLRRFEPTIGDILLIAVADDPQPIVEAVLHLVPEPDVRHHSARAVSVQFHREEINVRVVPPEEAGPALIHYTGSPGHVRLLQARAEELGLRLGAHALVRRDTNDPIPAASEADVYAALDLPLIPPEMRHGLDELNLAERRSLASLVTLGAIRGDLHTHTLWSDGRDTGETIVRSAIRLGYEYVAITDHSPSARASRVLTLDRLQQQMAEVRQLRTRFPEITILQGTEVDILPDGRLDFPDEVLAELDIVLASLHERNGDEGPQLLERYIAAMRHPLVNIITHPANRVPGQSEGYDLDYDRLFDVAAETGTALEVDGAPGHLDLDGHLARRAAAAGVTFTIDSDGHFAERLGRQMRMGVGTARRGAVEGVQVLNTRSVSDVRTFIARKRQRG